MNVCESLTVTAKLFPDKVAIIYGDQQITYRELDGLSQRAADVLSSGGVTAGDRVALMLPNAPSFPVWYYAALRIGAIAVSVSTRLAATEVNFVVSDCQATVFVVSNNVADDVLASSVDCVCVTVDAVSGQPVSDIHWSDQPDDVAAATWHVAEPDDPALILYTSGTTGFPKGATLSHGNVRSNVYAFNHLCNMQSHDMVLLAVPLFHCFGQNALLNSVLNVAGTIVLQQRFDLNESKRLIAEHQITQLYGVPMMFGLLLDSCTPDDLATINYCFSAAATLPLQTSQRWQQKFNLPIYEGYGLTETSPFATYNHRTRYVSGSIGMAIDSVEIKIVDTETGGACSPGELGEIAIRGPNVMLGYWNRPQETAQAIRDGWFYSGDIGRLDPVGYLYIVDRVKDMIAVGGLKVFPAEVERVLLDDANVTESAVIGVPDAVLGEQVIAYVVLSPGNDESITIKQIEQHARTHLGKYKLPRQIIAIDELPRNPSGKILKTRLRELASGSAQPIDSLANANSESAVEKTTTESVLASRLASTHAAARVTAAMEFVQQKICEICEVDQVPGPKDSFIDAGLDSLAIVELSAQLQTEVGPQDLLPATLLFDHPRVIDLAEHLVQRLVPTENKATEVDRSCATTKKQIPPRPKSAIQLRTEIESLSEAEALSELMKEIG